MRSLTLRLGMLYVALFSTSVLALGALLFWMSVRSPLLDVRRRVQQEATSLALSWQPGDPGTLLAALREREAAGGARLPFHVLLDPEGRALAANLPRWPATLQRGWLRIDAAHEQDGEIVDREALALDLQFGDGTRLIVGRDIEDIDEIEEKLLTAIVGVVAGAVLLALIGGLLMSVTIARRMSLVSQAARDIMAGDLSRRIPVRGGNDEFDELTRTLNQMLSRNEQLFESVRRVSDTVAHELRTPLARLRASLESLRAMSPGLDGAALEDAIAEVEGLEKTFDAVLRIARIESGRRATASGPIDMTALLRDVAEMYQPLIDERGQQLMLDIGSGLVSHGDRDLLFQSVCNLVDNASKYAPRGGTVRMRALHTGTSIELEISDDGPGIAPEHRDRVTERFYRVPATASAPGAGLGLSLVSAVAERHGSELTFGDACPGLSVRWKMPGA